MPFKANIIGIKILYNVKEICAVQPDSLVHRTKVLTNVVSVISIFFQLLATSIIVTSAVPVQTCLFRTGQLLIISGEPHIYVSIDKRIN